MRARQAWRKMTIVTETEHDTAQRRSNYPSARLPSQSALAPSGRCTSYSCGIGAPRPTRSRTTMTGSRFPGSRVIASDHLPGNPRISSGIYGRRLSAYSCGGSRGFMYLRTRTAFPWLALAGTTDHKRGIGSCCESIAESTSISDCHPCKATSPSTLPRDHTDDRLMPSSKTPIWRHDIDTLAFQPGEHTGLCMIHRRAFRTLLRATPSPRECIEYFNAHQEAFQAAARAKLLRSNQTTTSNFHLTSRDVIRQLQN
jgi:hypothetical protein